MRHFIAAFLLFLAALASVPALAQPADNGADAAVANAQANAAEDEAGGSAPPGNAADTDASDDDPRVLPESGQAIVKLFVLAVLLESALALLFNWRPFITYFDSRAVKPLVSFAAALAVVFSFQLETVADLLEAYGSRELEGSGLFISRVLEAMIIAGGSSGVNTILRNLGFRSISRLEDEPKQPLKDDEAWLAIALHRKDAVGAVEVEIEALSGSPKPKGGLAGTIRGTTKKAGLLSSLLQDDGRFPPSGGRTLVPGVEYEIRLIGADRTGAELKAERTIALAPRALVDLEFTL